MIQRGDWQKVPREWIGHVDALGRFYVWAWDMPDPNPFPRFWLFGRWLR